MIKFDQMIEDFSPDFDSTDAYLGARIRVCGTRRIRLQRRRIRPADPPRVVGFGDFGLWSVYFPPSSLGPAGFLFVFIDTVELRLEERSRSGCGQSGSIACQSQHQQLQHRSSPGSPVTVCALRSPTQAVFSHTLPMPHVISHGAWWSDSSTQAAARSIP